MHCSGYLLTTHRTTVRGRGKLPFVSELILKSRNLMQPPGYNSTAERREPGTAWHDAWCSILFPYENKFFNSVLSPLFPSHSSSLTASECEAILLLSFLLKEKNLPQEPQRATRYHQAFMLIRIKI